MKLGILSDIHEEVALLTTAIAELRQRGAERLVMLGDVADSGKHLVETVAILHAAGATGVWGNHELGLCLHPTDEMRQRYGDAVLAYFAELQGRLTIGDNFFCHFQAWMDPADLSQPWYLNGLPNTHDLLTQNFAAVPQETLFQGHYHRWLAATPTGVLDWHGETPVKLEPGQRYLFVIHAVCDGWCACYDDVERRLEPIPLTR